MPTISAIIPAYNEGPRLGAVLDVITTYPGFAEVIVVDDGSTDNTAEVVAEYTTVRYLKLPVNLGKGAAMDQAVQAASGDVIFFSDADMVGLTHEMIDQIIRPVAVGTVEMHIGMHYRLLYRIPFIFLFIRIIGGERALTRALWQRVPSYYKQRFRIEPALNWYATYTGRGFSYEIIPGLKQTIKEKKRGIWSGLLARWQMIKDIIKAERRLYQHYWVQRLAAKTSGQ